MLGTSQISSRKRVRVTVEVYEEEQEDLLQVIQGATPACEVVSVRRVNQKAKESKRPRRFEVPSADSVIAPPTPVCLFPRRNEIREEAGAQQEPSAPPQQDPSEAAVTIPACEFCLQEPCITSSPFKPQGRRDARITNHTKRLADYKWCWRTLKDCGLWENAIYQATKQLLGCHINDIREVMPNCVVKDVRGRWPNPPHVPYQGHRRA